MDSTTAIQSQTYSGTLRFETPSEFGRRAALKKWLCKYKSRSLPAAVRCYLKSFR